MDPLATISSVYNLAMFLKTWLDKTDDKISQQIALSNTVSRVCSILIPLQSAADFDPIIIHACLSLGEVLIRTKEHLTAFRDKQRNTLNPVDECLRAAQVIQRLTDDERDLTQELVMVLFSLAVVGFIRDRSLLPEKESNDIVFGGISNQEVLEFWRIYVEDKVGPSTPNPHSSVIPN